MGTDTGIDWCDHTHNPWRGCAIFSTGCRACYARVLYDENQAKAGPKGKPGPMYVKWGPNGIGHRVANDEKTLQLPTTWNRNAVAAGRRDRVFCASLADIFDDHEDIRPEWRKNLWKTIHETREGLDWLLLTKRAHLIHHYLPEPTATVEADGYPPWGNKGWPNVWLGVSVEDQDTGDARVPVLLSIPAAVHWLSCEPLIQGPLDLRPWLSRSRANGNRSVRWVVVGGESCDKRHDARPMDPQWVKDIKDHCAEAKPPAAFFFKQWGNFGPDGKDYGLNGCGADEKVVIKGKVAKKIGAGKRLDGEVYHNWPKSRVKRPKAARPPGRPTIGGKKMNYAEALAASRYGKAAREIMSADDIILAEKITTRLRKEDKPEGRAALARLFRRAMSKALVGFKPKKRP